MKNSYSYGPRVLQRAFTTRRITGRWVDVEKQRKFLDDFASEFGLKTPQDWGRISAKEVLSKGGTFITTYYNGSIFEALKEVYLEKNWNQDDFPSIHKVDYGHWNVISNERTFLEEIAREFNVKNLDDWKRVKSKHILDRNGSGLLKKYGGSLRRALKSVFPENDWSPTSVTFSQESYVSKSHQKIYELLKPHFNDLTSNVKHSELFHSSGREMELDLFSSLHKFALEYQGGQHYEQKYRNRSLSQQLKRDQEKREACEKAGITLIEVPYWWNGNEHQLYATIREKRPDLLTHITNNVALDKIPLIKPLLNNEKDFMLPHEFFLESGSDPTGWYITEKHSGMRGLWNGKDSFTILKDRRKINFLPKHVKFHFPREPLDGILRTNNIENNLSVNLIDFKKWKNVVFEVGDTHNLKQPFSSRLNHLKTIIRDENPFIKIANYQICKNREHFEEILSNSILKGGEGVLMIKPDSLYEVGRSKSCFELKSKFLDEAVVIKTVEQNKILVKNIFGIDFTISFDETLNERASLAAGTIIIYKCISLSTDGIPLFPSVHKIIKNRSWNDLTPFYVSIGETTGSSVCRGCRKRFSSSQPRVKTKGMFYSSESDVPKNEFVQFNYCLDKKCIDEGMKKDLASKNIVVPKFNNRIGISNISRKSNPTLNNNLQILQDQKVELIEKHVFYS